MQQISENNAAILQVPRLLTIKQCVEEKIYPNEGGLRSLIFNADKNGFNTVIRRVGKRCFIDVKAFYDWIEAINKVQQKGKTYNGKKI